MYCTNAFFFCAGGCAVSPGVQFIKDIKALDVRGVNSTLARHDPQYRYVGKWTHVPWRPLNRQSMLAGPSSLKTALSEWDDKRCLAARILLEINRIGCLPVHGEVPDDNPFTIYIHLSIHLSIYLSTYLPIYLPIYLSTYLPIYLSIYLSS